MVGGSDFDKIKEQKGPNILEEFDYVFAENGLVAYKGTTPIGSKSIVEHMGQQNVNRFVKLCRGHLSTLDIPVMTGTFIETRRGMINISPIGRNCTKEQRNAFEVYGKKEKVREKMINILSAAFPDLTFSIGGQISFDAFPVGRNKTFCLQFLKDKTIHFFGDKTFKGGNDHEIYVDQRVKGNAVISSHETMLLVRKFI